MFCQPMVHVHPIPGNVPSVSVHPSLPHTTVLLRGTRGVVGNPWTNTAHTFDVRPVVKFDHFEILNVVVLPKLSLDTGLPGSNQLGYTTRKQGRRRRLKTTLGGSPGINDPKLNDQAMLGRLVEPEPNRYIYLWR